MAGLDIILWYAAHDGYRDICELAIEKGANPTYVNENYEKSCLDIANDNNHRDIVHLLANDDEENKENDDENDDENDEGGMAADIILWIAARDGYRDICELAIEKGGDPTYVDDDADSISTLVIAYYNNHHDIADLLANKMSMDDLTKELCKHMQQRQMQMSLLRFLLEHGANPDGINMRIFIDTYLRPLHYAAYLNNVEMYDLLIEYGADPNIISSEGKLPSFYAYPANVIYRH